MTYDDSKISGITPQETVQVDFSEVDVQPGTYPATITLAEIKMNKAGDSKMLALKVQLNGGPLGTNGRELFYNLSFKPQALFKLRNTMKALGMATPKGAPVDINPMDWLNKQVNAVVVMGMWEGEERPEIKSLTKFDGATGGDPNLGGGSFPSPF
jgi:hypothetical protein